MPKGDIEFNNGASVHYDETTRVGDLVVYKRAYSHDVHVVKASEISSIEEREWHQTPFGSCKHLSEKEVRTAVENYRKKEHS